MTSVLTIAIVLVATYAFAIRARRSGVYGSRIIAGATALALGLGTSIPVTAQMLGAVPARFAGGQPLSLEESCLLVLALAIWLSGLFCVLQLHGLQRGDLEAQKRNLAAASILLGLTLPLILTEPLAALMSALALLNIVVLLFNRTNLELNEPPESLHYSSALPSELRLAPHRLAAGWSRVDN